MVWDGLIALCHDYGSEGILGIGLKLWLTIGYALE